MLTIAGTNPWANEASPDNGFMFKRKDKSRASGNTHTEQHFNQGYCQRDCRRGGNETQQTNVTVWN